jgi:hypothetical protein
MKREEREDSSVPSRVRFEFRSLDDLKPYPGNARTHSPEQLERLRDSISRFGFVSPAIVLEDGELVAGHGRTTAARLAGLDRVPVVVLTGFSRDEARAYCLADNRLADLAGWDDALLSAEVAALDDSLLGAAGFNSDEVEAILNPESDEDIPPAGDGGEAPDSSVRCPRCNHKFDLSEG